MSEIIPNRLVSRKEAATFLNIEPETLAVWASTKRYNLPYSKIGGRAKYWLSDLQAFADSRQIKHYGE
jgi:hypothetical protein